MRYIHKLPFDVPRGVRAIEVSALESTVKRFYDEVKKDASSVLAYKGGHVEGDLLKRLSIPCVNLECFGCPKAEELFGQLIWLETCGYHTIPNAYEHCVKVESRRTRTG